MPFLIGINGVGRGRYGLDGQNHRAFAIYGGFQIPALRQSSARGPTRS